MKTRTQNLFQNSLIACVVGVTLLSAGSAEAQQYTGAGSLYQPRPQYRMPQQQQPAQKPAPMPTYRPGVTDRAGNRYQYVPELGTYVVTDFSPQTARRIGDFAAKQVPACIKGAIVGAGGGFWKGGPSGAAKGAGAGCIGNAISN